jgi:hypothetical protein
MHALADFFSHLWDIIADFFSHLWDIIAHLDATEWSAVGAVASALIAVVAAFIARGQLVSARRSAATAKDQLDAAERSATAAEGSAATAKELLDAAARAATAAEGSATAAQRQLALITAQVRVEFTPVLLMEGTVHSPESRYPWVEVRWQGAAVTLERVVATQWAAFDGSGELLLETFSGSDVELGPAGDFRLPLVVKEGDKLLFKWPGAKPSPGFSAEVEIEYRLADGPVATIRRDVEVPGFSGFRG